MKHHWLALIFALTLVPRFSPAQGCTQCRDNTQATQPRTQGAYRGAILLLAGTALTVCSAIALAMRKIR